MVPCAVWSEYNAAACLEARSAVPGNLGVHRVHIGHDSEVDICAHAHRIQDRAADGVTESVHARAGGFAIVVAGRVFVSSGGYCSKNIPDD